MSSDLGFWVVSLRGRPEDAVTSEPWTVLHTNTNLQKVKIFLDGDLKAISFSMPLMVSIYACPNVCLGAFASTLLSRDPKR